MLKPLIYKRRKVFIPQKHLYIDSSVPASYTAGYVDLVATGTGVISTTVITASATVANKVQAGMKIRIGGTDVYTALSVSTTTINTVETLSSAYIAGSALAVERVSAFTDMSFNNYALAPTTGLKRPMLNRSKLSGYSSFAWDGACTVPLPADSYKLANGPNTTFAVAQLNVASGAVQTIYDFTEAGADRYTNFYGASNNISYRNVTGGGAGSTVTGLTLTNPHIVVGMFDGNKRSMLMINNGSPIYGGDNERNSRIDAAHIGSRADSQFYLSNANLFSLEIFTGNFTLNDIINRVRQMSLKWGVTVS